MEGKRTGNEGIREGTGLGRKGTLPHLKLALAAELPKSVRYLKPQFNYYHLEDFHYGGFDLELSL